MASEQLLATIKESIVNLFSHTSFEAIVIINVFLLIFFVAFSVWFFWQRKTNTAKLANPFAKPKLVGNRFARIVLYLPRKLTHFVRRLLRPTLPLYFCCLFGMSIFSGLTIINYFCIRPHVVATYPATTWVDQKYPLRIVFDKPINTAEFKLNIDPEVTGHLVWKPSVISLAGANFYREVEFYPDTTITPEEQIIVYLVGIKNLASADGMHEQNLAFNSAAMPNVFASSLLDKTADVPTSRSIIVTYDAPLPPSVAWEYAIEPKTTVAVIKVNAYSHLITFPEGLKQTTSYVLKANRSEVVRDLAKDEILNSEVVDPAFSLNFTTLKAPLVQSISPEGQAVDPALPLKIVFDTNMDPASVESMLKIEPEITGKLEWANDNKELTFTPTQPWLKDTGYKLTISKEAKAATQAILDTDLVHSFHTAGPVKATNIVPANGATNIPTSPTISFVFDQEVDHASAQQLFSISPGIGGNFSWSGTTMNFNPQKLAYSTTYTVKLAKGVKAIYGLDSNAEFSTQFKTVAGQVMLNVPQYYQQEGQTCNIAATRMVLAYRGVYRSEAQIKSAIGIGAPLNGGSGGDPYVDWIDNYGTYWTTVSSYIGGFRQNAVRQGWNVTDMLREVQRGNPVILWWQNGWSSWYWKTWTTPDGKTITGLNGMHSEVVVGFKGEPENPSAIITHDPWRGTRTYSKSSFDNLWKNSFNRTAIVVY